MKTNTVFLAIIAIAVSYLALTDFLDRQQMREISNLIQNPEEPTKDQKRQVPKPWRSQVANPPPVDMAKEAQQMLIQLGYDIGEPTGEVRGDTVAAVLDYQFDHGLPTTGEIDAALLEHLRAQIEAKR